MKCLKCEAFNLLAKQHGFASGMCEECANKSFVILDLPYQPERSNENLYKASMKCHWCERETNNESELMLNGLLQEVKVYFCDECKKAENEANEIIIQLVNNSKCDIIH
jgi:hypothetical protein